MNGPSCMYTVRPLNKLEDNIELPARMYHMKNVQKSVLTYSAETPRPCPSSDSSHKTTRSVLEQNPLPEIIDLEDRQEAVLAQLQQLKHQMAQIKNVLKTNQPANICKPANSISNDCDKSKESLTKFDIVINVNPQNPPYSLVALSNVWPKSSKLKIICHIHSSVKDVPNELTHAFQTNEDPASDDCKYPMGPVITLIWKYVGRDAELVISPSNNITIRGEVNILRFLSRLTPQFNYAAGNNIIPTTTDAILDTCHSLLWSNTIKERQSLIRTLNANLKKSPYLQGECISIADIAAWSVLKQLSAMQDMSANMTKWYQRCTETFRVAVL